MTELNRTTRALAFAGTILIAAWAASAPQGVAKTGLGDEPGVFDRLLTGAVVSETYKHCDRIDPRKIKATLFVLGTVQMARGLGYSMDDIEKFRNDKVQQDRLRTATLTFFAEHDVDTEIPETYCTFGEAEIANNSRIGKFLKRR